MLKLEPKTIKNKRFSDPEWYVSIAADLLDLKFATLAKDLGKALHPEVIDTAKELLNIYDLAFNGMLESLRLDQRVESQKGNEQLFFDHIIDPDFPSHHPVFYELMLQLTNLVELDFIEQNSEKWNDIRSSLRNDFAINFNSIIQSGSNEHSNATKYIGVIKNHVPPIESQSIAHMNSILEEVEYEALAIDPELTLRKSYVTPSCNKKLEKMSCDEESKALKSDNIIQTLLDQIKSDHLPIVIHGQPGHGKTSSVKMLVSALSQIHQFNKDPISILFYEFKNLRALESPILQVLSSETSFLTNENFFNGKHTVLILDGLDERQLADGSDDALKSFVSGIFRLAERVNKVPGSKLNLILTGRSQYVGQIKSCFSQEHMVFEIGDFSKEQVSLWLNRFNSQKINSENVTIEKLHKYHLQELTSQPILLASSAIMLCDREGKKLLSELDRSIINRTQIYKTIIRWSYDKKWQKSPTAYSLQDNLSFDNYFVLLQAIAYEMFKSGNENIKLSLLASSLKNSFFELDFLENKNIENIEKLCSQLRISFFFKGVEDKSFSFIHKTIKDFLIVSGLVDSFSILLKHCNKKKLDKEAPELYKMLGESKLSSEDHVPMLGEWLSYKANDIKPHNDTLIAIWERVGGCNLPVSFETPEQAINTQYNILYNYYQLISRHFLSSSPEENQQLFGQDKIVLFGELSDQYNLIKFESFCGKIDMRKSKSLCFSNQSLEGEDTFGFPSLLQQCDFSKSTLSKFFMMNTSITLCNFESAQILDSWIGEATFTDCNFYNATINCISQNVHIPSRPNSLSYLNQFLGCDFSKATLSENRRTKTGHPNRKRQFLFWNCNFNSTAFECIKTSTVKYGKNFEGTKLPS